MNEFCIFIADQKSENTKHKTNYDKQTLCKFCPNKNEKKEVKDVLFPLSPQYKGLNGKFTQRRL